MLCYAVLCYAVLCYAKVVKPAAQPARGGRGPPPLDDYDA